MVTPVKPLPASEETSVPPLSIYLTLCPETKRPMNPYFWLVFINKAELNQKGYLQLQERRPFCGALREVTNSNHEESQTPHITPGVARQRLPQGKSPRTEEADVAS